MTPQRALLALLIVFFTAPLTLFSYAVVQQERIRLIQGWYSALTALLALGLLLASLAALQI